MKNTETIKVLIADDNPIIRAILRKTLNILSKDLDVQEAVNGEECLKKLNEFKPDLVLLDLMMPRVNGLKILQRLYTEKENDFYEIIVISGIEDKDSIALSNCLKFGANDFVYKPFKGKILLYKLLNMLKKIIIKQNYHHLKKENIEFRTALDLEIPAYDDHIEIELNLQKSETENTDDDSKEKAEETAAETAAETDEETAKETVEKTDKDAEAATEEATNEKAESEESSTENNEVKNESKVNATEKPPTDDNKVDEEKKIR